MAIIMRTTNGYRRADFITAADAEKMVEEGKAFKHAGYEIWEETDGAVYATKVMEPAKRRGRPAKVQEEAPAQDGGAE
jgi:hypothetical protein